MSENPDFSVEPVVVAPEVPVETDPIPDAGLHGNADY